MHKQKKQEEADVTPLEVIQEKRIRAMESDRVMGGNRRDASRVLMLLIGRPIRDEMSLALAYAQDFLVSQRFGRGVRWIEKVLMKSGNLISC